MPDDSIIYSINTFTGDGTTTIREISFAGGYLLREHVKAYRTNNSTGVVTDAPFSFVSDFTVQETTATPTGSTLTIYRDTPKDEPVVDFNDGSIINEQNLDTLAKQSVFVAAEAVDKFGDTRDVAEQAREAALASTQDSTEALALASSSAADAAEALATANATSDQFDALAANVEEITGADFTDFAKLSAAQTYGGVQTFSQPIKVGASGNYAEFRNDGYIRLTLSNVAGSWVNPFTPAYADITGKPTNFPTNIANVSGLQAALDAKATVSDLTDLQTTVKRNRRFAIASTIL